MMDAQLDTHDIQARISLPYILKSVNSSLDSAINLTQRTPTDRVRLHSLLQRSFQHLESWNFNFDLPSVGASLFQAFEFNFATYFQETKIDDADVRRGIHGNVIIENFFYKEIHQWAEEKSTYRDYCVLTEYVEKAGRENTCQEFMAYVYIKALEDLY
jgi:acyl-homoserine lactone acylase PvdQ